MRHCESAPVATAERVFGFSGIRIVPSSFAWGDLAPNESNRV
jgi:hypothetical protein